jgi:hypothetical protein
MSACWFFRNWLSPSLTLLMGKVSIRGVGAALVVSVIAVRLMMNSRFIDVSVSLVQKYKKIKN